MENIICTMDNVWEDFLRPPHGTTPAAVIGNKDKTEILKSSEHINEERGWAMPRFRLLRPLQ